MAAIQRQTLLGRLFGRAASWLSPAEYRVDSSGTDVPVPRCPRCSRSGAGLIPRRSKSEAGWRPGFTMIEIIVVVIIIGIAAAIAIPRMSAGADFQATSAARMVAVDIQYAQNHAIASQRKVRVVFTPAASGDNKNCYSVIYTDTNTPIIHPVNKDAYTVSFAKMKDFSALKLDSAKFGSTNRSYVEFDPIGAPDNAGKVVIRAGRYTYEISVAAITGKVTVVSN